MKAQYGCEDPSVLEAITGIFRAHQELSGDEFTLVDLLGPNGDKVLY